jgi:hypothetical protein
MPFQSREDGVRNGARAAALGSVRSPDEPRWFGPPLLPSVALGVGQSFAATANGIPAPLPFLCFRLRSSALASHDSGLSPSLGTQAAGVGHIPRFFAAFRELEPPSITDPPPGL